MGFSTTWWSNAVRKLSAKRWSKLLWHVFEPVTSSLARDFELKNRAAFRDSRRIVFAKQVELLGALSVQWADRRRREHAVILSRHPFDDRASERATLCAALREAGQSDDVAWRNACERYPLPADASDPQEEA
jgi:hypothetical protein